MWYIVILAQLDGHLQKPNRVVFANVFEVLSLENILKDVFLEWSFLGCFSQLLCLTLCWKLANNDQNPD